MTWCFGPFMFCNYMVPRPYGMSREISLSFGRRFAIHFGKCGKRIHAYIAWYTRAMNYYWGWLPQFCEDDGSELRA